MTDKIVPLEVKRELAAPPDVEAHGGTEILRLFVSGGALSLSMQRGFDRPETWGRLLADLAQHVAGVYERETSIDAETALAEISAAFDAALDPEAMN
jgi:hypothetical protein